MRLPGSAGPRSTSRSARSPCRVSGPRTSASHLVPLSARSLVDILKGIPRRRDLVFGKGAGGFQGWSKCKAELDTKLNIPDWTVHDIRRTVATRMAEEPVSVQPHIIEAVLNHVVGAQGRNRRHLQQGDLLAGEAQGYQHLGAPDHHVLAQASGTNVLPLRGQR